MASYRSARVPVLTGLSLLLACGSIDEHIRDLGSEDLSVRETAAYRLLLKGKVAAPALIAVIDTGSGNRAYIATQLLGKIGAARAVEPLIQQLTTARSTALREATAEALGKTGDDRAITPLRTAALSDSVAAVRVAAVQALATLRYEDTAVYATALQDWHPDVRHRALLALVRLARSELGPYLTPLADDPDSQVRYLVVQLLGSAQRAEAIPLLIDALDDSTGAIREEAALALGRFQAMEAKSALIDLMVRSDDPDGLAARKALRQITGVDWAPTD
jgi:HEAT repeat protein